jgi:3-isopropylmalate/(R)-2-methylmalate dehydratase small subunit
MHKTLLDNEGIEVAVDLESLKLETETGKSYSFPMESFSRYCLINGIDQLGYIMSQELEITKYENAQ